MTAVFSSPLPGHDFLTPDDSPPGDCDSHGSCTEALVVSVSYPGLEEVPPPILTAVDQVTGRAVQVPWVRCGKTGSGGTSPCTAEADNAALSVPEWGTCGARPFGSTLEERIRERGQTALHEPGVLAPAGLFLPYANDPDHVRLTRGASAP
ncbi:MAG: hypothetical protein EDX89_02690 [Acidobacteria bacterium]|nr:MAG: hypothetical protein EDX89_02690 [Acidobacteriota bacterium]MCE7957281.1 hypothetical protein [Acidobacteria bacterium ACB2]